jgi:hypothetical protein
MKITEKMLLDGYYGLTNGGDKISTINNCDIRWNYRYNHGEGAAVCDRDRADIITLEYDRDGEIALDDNCDNHQAIVRINSDEQQLWGNELLDTVGL